MAAPPPPDRSLRTQPVDIGPDNTPSGYLPAGRLSSAVARSNAPNEAPHATASRDIRPPFSGPSDSRQKRITLTQMLRNRECDHLP